MDKTEFIQLHEFEKAAHENVDDILANANQAKADGEQAATAGLVDDDFLSNLGL